ncbi:MAG: hypothetical protein RSA86_06710 [Christensenellaceae bacterium]
MCINQNSTLLYAIKYDGITAFSFDFTAKLVLQKIKSAVCAVSWLKK